MYGLVILFIVFNLYFSVSSCFCYRGNVWGTVLFLSLSSYGKRLHLLGLIMWGGTPFYFGLVYRFIRYGCLSSDVPLSLLLTSSRAVQPNG